ncbi:MAG: hypothetical protein ACH349_07375 [Candidatus Rhabdochlamydia sp.]
MRDEGVELSGVLLGLLIRLGSFYFGKMRERDLNLYFERGIFYLCSWFVYIVGVFKDGCPGYQWKS